MKGEWMAGVDWNHKGSLSTNDEMIRMVRVGESKNIDSQQTTDE